MPLGVMSPTYSYPITIDESILQTGYNREQYLLACRCSIIFYYKYLRLQRDSPYSLFLDDKCINPDKLHSYFYIF